MNGNHTPQEIIEQKMREIVRRGNYDMAHLFSSEGLLLAESYNDHIIEKDRLAEMSLLLRELRKMADVMGKISSIKETIVEGFNSRKIVFRFFQAFEQEVILALVIPPKKSYRGLTNSLIKMIENLSQ